MKNNMVDLVVFCVESNKKSKSDSFYINEYLKSHFQINKVRLDFVFMGGKGNFDKSSTTNQINRIIANFNKSRIKNCSRKSKVVYCIDLDDESQEQKALTNRIFSFCKDQNYDVIWFCKDIESVFLGHTVSKRKDEEAMNWVIRGGKISSKAVLNDVELSSSNHHSNCHTILSKYFQRK